MSTQRDHLLQTATLFNNQWNENSSRLFDLLKEQRTSFEDEARQLRQQAAPQHQLLQSRILGLESNLRGKDEALGKSNKKLRRRETELREARHKSAERDKEIEVYVDQGRRKLISAKVESYVWRSKFLDNGNKTKSDVNQLGRKLQETTTQFTESINRVDVAQTRLLDLEEAISSKPSKSTSTWQPPKSRLLRMRYRHIKNKSKTRRRNNTSKKRSETVRQRTLNSRRQKSSLRRRMTNKKNNATNLQRRNGKPQKYSENLPLQSHRLNTRSSITSNK